MTDESILALRLGIMAACHASLPDPLTLPILRNGLVSLPGCRDITTQDVHRECMALAQVAEADGGPRVRITSDPDNRSITHIYATDAARVVLKAKHYI